MIYYSLEYLQNIEEHLLTGVVIGILIVSCYYIFKGRV